VKSFIAPGSAPQPAAAPAASPETTASLRHWVTIAGIALIALIIGADSYEAWQDYRTAVADNERTQVMLGRALAEQTARMIQAVDVVLADFADWRRSAEGQAADEQGMRERLRSEIMRMQFIHSAAVTGPDGQFLAATQSGPIANRTLEKRAAFVVPATSPDDVLYVGRPFVGRRDQARTFPLSRRINDTKGALAGVVVVRVSDDYLAQFYSAVNVATGTSIRLARDDGVTLATFPAGDLPIADDVDVRDSYSRLAQSGEEVHYARANGHERVAVLHKVEGYPIVIEVTRSLPDVLQPWIRQEVESASRTLVLALLAGLLLVALRAALTRHERTELERRRLEQALENSQRAEALGFLATSVAHDFNNVLTAIVGYAELARNSITEGAPRLAHIDRLLAATERARLLVRRVLTFNPRRSLSDQPIRIAPVIAEVEHQVEATLPQAVTLEVSGLDPSATMLGDATEVHQVLMNLCTNAVHAMPAGGTIEIGLESVDVHAERELTVGKLQPGRWIRVSISDTGMGMTEEQLGTVFEPFYTTRKPGQGTGIGLTVVRNIIMSTNGALEVESRLGSGTRMSVYWPRVEVPAVPPELGRAPGRGQTIMVVDDEVELVALAEEVLASLGYEPVGFSDSRAALEAFRRAPRRFDAVLTDERMTMLRGIDLAKSIHEIDPNTPVILMTGHRDTETDERAREAGIAEVLDKPLRIETVRTALGRRLPMAAA